MGILDRSDKKNKKEESVSTKEEQHFENSWNDDTLKDDQRQAEVVAEKQYHVVQEGESLSEIAKKYYGNADQWQVICDANQDQIENTDEVQPGQRLYIPDIE